MIYWFTGTAVLKATGAQIVYWMAPVFIANLIYMYYLAGNRVLPIMTDITQLLTAFVICQTIVAGIVRPFGRPFKVTAKGHSQKGITIQWAFLWPHALLAALTLLGMILNLSSSSPVHGRQGYSPNIVWSLFNAAILTLAAMSCIEPPRRRRDERFPVDERAFLRFSNTSTEPHKVIVPVQMKDISLGGAAVSVQVGATALIPASHDIDALIVNQSYEKNLLEIPATSVSSRGQLVALKFSDQNEIRHALIRKLYMGDYHREIERISASAVFTNLVLTLLF